MKSIESHLNESMNEGRIRGKFTVEALEDREVKSKKNPSERIQIKKGDELFLKTNYDGFGVFKYQNKEVILSHYELERYFEVTDIGVED